MLALGFLIVAGAGTAWAQGTWTGLGDHVSWNDPGNWSGGTVPGALDSVVLDNSIDTGDFSVDLPAAASTMTLSRLTLSPSPGRSITLILPPSNTGNPGLRVGDGLAGTDDIVLGAGATLRNSSGAWFGNGIEVYSLGNGTIRIDNGARYVHATARGASGVVPGLSTSVGTEHGVFEYDVPDTAVSNIAASGRTYGDLTLTRSAGPARYAAFGSSALTIRGDFRIGSGITFSSTMSGPLRLAGDLVNDGTTLLFPASQSVIFEGAGTRAIRGTSEVHIAGPARIEAEAVLAIAGSTLVIGDSLSVMGSLRIDPGGVAGGSGVYTYAPVSSSLIFNRSYAIDGQAFWPTSLGPPNVSVENAGAITMSVPRAIPGALRLSAPLVGAENLTLSGEFRLQPGASVSGSPTYQGEARLVYAAGLTVGDEWGPGDITGGGVPRHVSVDAGASAVALPGSDRTVPGDLDISSGALVLGSGPLTLLGDFTTSAPLTLAAGTLVFGGAGTQQISGPGDLGVAALRLAKSGGAVVLARDLRCSTALDFAGSVDVLDLGGRSLTLGGSVGGSNASALLRGGGTSRMIVGGSGALGTVSFAPDAAQLERLAIDRADQGSVTLGAPLSVTDTLALTQGTLIVGDHVLALETGAIVARSSGMVWGSLRKSVPPGTSTLTFEVGAAGSYAPVEVVCADVTGPGTLTASSFPGDHPDLSTSPLDASRTVNRHWRLTHDGAAFDHSDVILRFEGSEVDSMADSGSFRVWRYDGNAWSTGTAGARTPNSTQVTGLTSFGDFQIGNAHYALQAGVTRDDRYALEVSFPSASASRVVVNEAMVPSLGNLDPGAIPERTLTIYRDGRVLAGAPAPAARASTENRRARDARDRRASALLEAAPLSSTTPETVLQPTFIAYDPGFAPYFAGTVAPAWGDYDNDGDVDLPLYRNNGDRTFSDIPGFRPLLDNGNYHGSAWGDYDQDGDLDLVMLSYYIAGATNPTRTRLLRNDGNDVFVDVAADQGIDFQNRGETAIWADFNLDGRPDLFAPYYSHVIPYDSYFFMYFNDGAGNLVDVSDSAGVALTNRFVEGVDLTDWDGDGDLDLYFTSRLYLNDGSGHFTDASAAAGLPDIYDEGGAFVDYDNDGDFDLYARNGDIPRLYRNDNGALTDVTTASGIPVTDLFWGDTWSDVDNDGDQDLLCHIRSDRARLMLNQGDGTFVDDPNFASVDDRGGMAAWADFDRDGDLDLVDNAPPEKIYENQLDTQPGFENSYLRVRVLDALGLETEHGAVIRLRPLNGAAGLVQTRTVGGGGSYLSHNEYTAHFGIGVPGSVVASPAQAEYADGATVELTAVPDLGYRFDHWTGDAAGTANPLTIVMSGPMNVSATFTLVTHALSTVAGIGGSITRSPDQPTYPYGSRVHLGAVPDAGYSFIGWGGDAAGSVNPLTVTIDADHVVTAAFGLNAYLLGVTSVGAGVVSRSPDQASYLHGSEVQLTAAPGAGYHFDHWSGDLTGSANPITLSMNGPRDVTAVFEINTYTLTLEAVGSGTVTKNPDQPGYPHGSLVGLTATPAARWRFVGWSGDHQGTEDPLSVVMDRDRMITATFVPIEVVKWIGGTAGGNGLGWSDARNWSGGNLPATYDEVLLDNSTVAADYPVRLPGGSVTTSILKLTIAPASGRTITLTLPSSNTAAPGLEVGDFDAATDDIVLNDGAELTNVSGAASGNGIETRSSAGQVRIETGARYVHSTLRSPSGIAPRLTVAAGTETGAFVYDVPGRGSFAILASGVTYGSLELARTAGSATYTAMGTDSITVRGDLTLESGITLASSMTGALRLAGSVINNGATLVVPASQAAHFVGAGVQYIGGSATLRLNGGSRVAAGTTLACGAAPFTNNGSMTIEGTLRIDPGVEPGGSGAYVYDAVAGTLVFNDTSPVIIGSSPYWPTANGPPTITVAGSGGISMNAARTVFGRLQVMGPVKKAHQLTIAGSVELGLGGSLSNPPVYSGNGTLVYGTGVAVGDEWAAGSNVGAGVPRNVIVLADSETIGLPGSDRTVPGDLTIDAGTLASNPSAGDLILRGNLVVNGTMSQNGRALRFAGGGTQTISSAESQVFGSIQLAKDGGSVRLLTPVTIAGGIDFAGSADVVELNDRTLTFAGTLGGTNADGAFQGGPGSRLILNGGGTVGTLRFVAGGAQLQDLTVNLAGAGSVTLASTLTIARSLELLEGTVTTDSNVVSIGPAGTVTRSNGHVSGRMRKTVSTGAPGLTFEIGAGGVYSPVEVGFVDVTEAGTLTAWASPGDHPNLSSSTLPPNRTVNRWWTLSSSGTVFARCDATFHFVPGDVDPGADPDGFAVRRYQAPDWFMTPAGIRTPTSTSAGPLTTFGDFAIGEIQVHQLGLLVDGNGVVESDPDQPEYDHGTLVTLTPRPAAGHTFIAWGGDTAATSDPLAITITSDRTLIARFTYELSTTVSGSGTIQRDPDLTGYAPGAMVTLTAVAAPGNVFQGWQGDTTGTANPVTLMLSGNADVLAQFADIEPPTVEVLSPNGGEYVGIGTTVSHSWSATDGSGVKEVDLHLSRHGAAGPFEVLATGMPNTGTFEWLATGPATAQALLRVTARDSAGNESFDLGDQTFTILDGALSAEDAATEFSLSVAPNPIRSTLRVVHGLPRPSRVRAVILDLQGREVAVLDDGVRAAGTHSLTWNATGLAPGMYFVRFRTPGHDRVRRIVVAR